MNQLSGTVKYQIGGAASGGRLRGAAGGPVGRRSLISRHPEEALLGILLILPAFVFQVVFHVWPIVYSCFISLLDWDLLSGRREFVGLLNYEELLGSSDFWRVAGNTALYSLGTVVVSTVIGLFLAVALNNKSWLSGVVESAAFAPYVISLVSISLLWQWMLEPQWGLFNAALSALGLPKLKWLSSSREAMPSIIMVSVWRSAGYAMLLCLSGLQGIPASLYEAAEVEGASKRRQLWAITIPILSPTLFFLAIVLTLGTFQAFDIVAIMTHGGPGDSTMLWVYHVYKLAFEYFRFGTASASAVLLFVVLSLVTVVQFKVINRRVFYS